MDKKLKIFIVDDHDMFREGVKVLLGKSQKLEFIGEASNGKEFLSAIQGHHPDVILMDISMPVMDGIEATRQAILSNPNLKILALSMFGEEEYYYKMIQSGVRGFVMKSAGINELEHAIQEVARGSAYFSPELLHYVKQNIADNASGKNLQNITDVEITILKSLAQNISEEDIAKSIHQPPEMMQNLKESLMKKTGSSNTAGLVMFAIKNKIVSL
jgi:DNA-binding NarL/FixJ family response regulator